MTVDQQAAQSRFQLADMERQHFKVTLRTLINPKGTPQERQAAIESYIALLDRNDRVRADNPVPSVPTRCT